MQFTTRYSEIENLDHFQIWFSLPVSATRFQPRDHFEFRSTLSALAGIPCPDEFQNLVLGALEELDHHVQDLPIFRPWEGYHEFRETQSISAIVARNPACASWLQLSGFHDGIEKLYSHIDASIPSVETALELLSLEIARQQRRIDTLLGESR